MDHSGNSETATVGGRTFAYPWRPLRQGDSLTVFVDDPQGVKVVCLVSPLARTIAVGSAEWEHEDSSWRLSIPTEGFEAGEWELVVEVRGGEGECDALALPFNLLSPAEFRELAWLSDTEEERSPLDDSVISALENAGEFALAAANSLGAGELKIAEGETASGLDLMEDGIRLWKSAGDARQTANSLEQLAGVYRTLSSADLRRRLRVGVGSFPDSAVLLAACELGYLEACGCEVAVVIEDWRFLPERMLKGRYDLIFYNYGRASERDKGSGAWLYHGHEVGYRGFAILRRSGLVGSAVQEGDSDRLEEELARLIGKRVFASAHTDHDAALRGLLRRNGIDPEDIGLEGDATPEEGLRRLEAGKVDYLVGGATERLRAEGQGHSVLVSESNSGWLGTEQYNGFVSAGSRPVSESYLVGLSSGWRTALARVLHQPDSSATVQLLTLASKGLSDATGSEISANQLRACLQRDFFEVSDLPASSDGGTESVGRPWDVSDQEELAEDDYEFDKLN